MMSAQHKIQIACLAVLFCLAGCAMYTEVNRIDRPASTKLRCDACNGGGGAPLQYLYIPMRPPGVYPYQWDNQGERG